MATATKKKTRKRRRKAKAASDNYARLLEARDSLVRHRDEVAERIEKLKKAGLAIGTTYKQRGYWYHQWSDHDGRQRDYIGHDLKKLKRIREAIDRTPVHDNLCRHLRQVEMYIETLELEAGRMAGRVEDLINRQQRFWSEKGGLR